MNKIVHCIGGLEVGGTEMMLYKTVTRMDPQRFQSLVISTTSYGPIGERLMQARIPVIALGKRPGIPNLLTVWRLYRILQHERPALVQTHMYEANLYGLVAARLARIPVVWGIRCAEVDFQLFSRLSSLGFRLNQLLSRFPDAIVVNSEAGRAYHLAQGFDGRRMVVAPNGFELDRFQPNPEARRVVRAELGISDDAFLVGRFARLDPLKDYTTLFQAAGQVAQAHPNVFFLFAGTGVVSENPVFARAIEQEGLAGRILLLGHRDDTPRLMASLDISVSSSLSEGFPNVVGEAMACGVPCVVTDVGDSAFIVGDSGRVVPAQDAAALAGAIGQLVKMPPEERAHLGQAARKRVQEHFDICQVAERTAQLYVDVLAGKELKPCVA